MAVLSYLKASVCLVILVSLSPSTHPAIPFDCPKACVSSKGQTALDSCISRCNQIVGFVTQRYPIGQCSCRKRRRPRRSDRWTYIEEKLSWKAAQIVGCRRYSVVQLEGPLVKA